MDAFEQYNFAYYLMKAEFNILSQQVVEKDLNDLKNSGKTGNYLLLLSVLQAEDVIDHIYESQGDDGKFVDFNFKVFDSLSQNFRTSIDQLIPLVTEKEKLEKEGLNVTFGASRFVNTSNDYIKELRSFKERVEKNNWRYSGSHPHIPDNGSVEKINKLYSELIDSYNKSIN